MTDKSQDNPPASSYWWKEQLLNRIMVGMVIVGILAMIYTGYRTVTEGRYFLLLFYGMTFGLLCVVTFVRGLNYSIRAGVMLVLFYLVGITDLAFSGLWGNGPLFLFVLILLAHTFFNLRYGLAAFALSLLTLGMAAWLAVVQQYRFSLQDIYFQNNIISWLRLLIVFILVSTIIILSIRQLVQYLKQELRAKELEYNFVSDVLNMASTIVIVLDTAGRIVHLNQHCARVTGLSFDDMRDKPFWQIFVVPSGQAIIQEKFRQFIETRRPLQQELRTPSLIGQDKIISWGFTVMDSATTASYVVAVGADITLQQQAKQEHEQLLLAEREQRQFAEVLGEAGLALTSTLDLDTLLDRLLEYVGKIVPYDAANIMLIDDGAAKVARTRGYEKFDPDVNDEMTYKVFTICKTQNLKTMIESKSPLIISDVQQYPHWINIKASNYLRSWLGAPIVAQDKVIACFSLNKIEPGFFRPEHRHRLEIFAGQAALAMEKARLFEAETRQRREAEILYSTAAVLTSALELSEVLDKILVQLQQIIPYDSACIFLLENDWLKSVAARGFTRPEQVVGHSYPATDPLTQVLCETRQPLYLKDAQADPRFRQYGDTDYVRGWLGVPLIVNDNVIGVMTLDHREPNYYTERHLSIAAAFAHQAAIALENAELFEAANQRVAELEAVRQAALSLTAKLDLQSVLNSILDVTYKLIPDTKNTHIFLFENAELTFGASILENGQVNKPFAKPRPKGLTHTVAETGQTIVVPDIKNHPLFTAAPADWNGSIVGIPLKIGTQIVGVMTISSFQSRQWSAAELRTLELLADQAAIAIENARLYKQVQQHAAELEDRVARRTFELQTLYELTQALSQANHFDDTLHLALGHLRQAMSYDVAAGLLVTGETGLLLLQTRYNLAPEADTFVQQFLQDAVSVKPQQLEIRYLETPSEHLALQRLKSRISAPLVVEQKTVGMLLVGSQLDSAFSEQQAQLLQTIADQAAETIRRLQLLLAAEHKRLESLIADLPNGIVLLNSEHRLVLTNQVAKNLLPNLVVGRTLTAIGQHKIKDILTSAAAESPYVLQIKNGLDQYLEIDVNPVTAGPESGGWTLVIRDVTEERLVQKRAQQQERLAAVGQLAAGIAHDFNNILTSIIGYAELLLAEESLQPDLREDVERITNQGQRAANLVRQILDFSRQTITEKHPLDLVPFVKETIRLLERTLPENINIVFAAPSDPYVVVADIAQMQQVITNLAVNARDAMPSGGKLGFELDNVVFSEDIPPPFFGMGMGPWIVLKISDTGNGIPKENQGQIFEPFFTTKEVGKGTGLGLAQVYGIIKQHEGFIEVESQLDIGATFSIYLPPYTQPQLHSSARPPLQVPHGRGELILMVEDDQSVLEIGTTMLRHLGYGVLTATNGREALELYRQFQDKITVVLTDMTMPAMGGAELTAELQALNPNVKVIALTGYPLQTEARYLLSEGIVDWLQKPLRLKVLGETIHRTLQIEEEKNDRERSH